MVTVKYTFIELLYKVIHFREMFAVFCFVLNRI